MPVPCYFCNKLIDRPDADSRWHATHPSDPAPRDCYSEHGHRPPTRTAGNGDDRPAFTGAFCCLCGNTDVADLGEITGICLDADACHQRQQERAGMALLKAALNNAAGIIKEQDRKLARIRSLLTSGPIGRASGERYIRADCIRTVLDGRDDE